MSTQWIGTGHLSIFIVDARRVIPANAPIFVSGKTGEAIAPAAGDNVGIVFQHRL